jgi:four helix bundle protein
MSGIQSFEDIDAWKKARELTKEIYRVTTATTFSRDFTLSNQIRRAAISIMSNIAEGYERRGDNEFRRFLIIAKGSLGEVRTQLIIANDVGLLTDEDYSNLSTSAKEVGRMLNGFIKYIAQSV